MTDDRSAADPAAAGGAPRAGCMTAFLILLGIVMVLPGLCAGVFLVVSPGDVVRDGGLFAVWLICLLIGIGGVVLIARARRLGGRTNRVNE